MAKYDFTNPQDQNAFRQEASARGASIKDTNAYIARRRNEQEINIYGVAATGKSNAPASAKTLSAGETTNLADYDSALNQLGTLSSSLSNRQVTGPVQGLVRGLNPYDTEFRDIQAEIDTARQIVGKALEGGVLRKEDEEKYKKILPTTKDTQAVAQRKIENLNSLLTNKRESTTNLLKQAGYNAPVREQVGVDNVASEEIGLGQEMLQPAVNVAGALATPGDLIRNPETGKMSFYGDAQDAPLFKQDMEFGFRVDNSLIRFLAKSEFLPILGGFAGSITGGVVGGAGGASLGAGVQQGLRELLDPDQQDFSTMAKVVLVAGITDAAFSGLALGIGKVGKATGIVLTQPGSAATKAVIGSSDEVVDAARGSGKSLPFLGTQEDLLRKAYPLSPEVKAEFTEKQGTSIYNKVIEFLNGDLNKLVDPQEAAKVFEAGGKQAGKEIGEAITGRAVSADEIIPKLKGFIAEIQKEAIDEVGNVTKITPRSYKSGVDDLLEKISILEAEAQKSNGFISLNTLQDMKVDLNKAFKGEMVSQSSKELLATSRGELMTTIEKYGGKGIKESNTKYYVFDLMKDSALRADEKVIRQAFDAMDLITLGSSTAMSGGNIAVGAMATVVQKFLRNFAKEPLQQLRLVNKLGSYAVEKGNKNAFRAIMLAAQKLNLTMGIDQALLKSSIQTGKEVINQQSPDDFVNQDQGIIDPSQMFLAK